MPDHITAVAGEHILNRQDGVAASEHMHQFSGGNCFGAEIRGFFNLRSDPFAVDLLDHLHSVIYLQVFFEYF